MAEALPPPEGNELQERVEVLPYAGSMPILDERVAMVTLLMLSRGNERLHAAIRSQFDRVEETIKPDLQVLYTPNETETYYAVSQNVLRAIVARSVVAGAAQVAYGIGDALLQMHKLEAFMRDPADEGNNQHRDGEEAPPEA